MPAVLPVWSRALSEVDRSEPPPEVWYYWLPEPALVIGSSVQDRLERYVLNWLRIREAWLYVQQQRHVHLESPALKTQQWREMLNLSEKTESESEKESRSQQRKAEALRVLAETCELTDMRAFLSAPVTWYGQEFQISDQMCREVIWELCELGFRAELYQLDRYLGEAIPSSTKLDVDPDPETEREDRIAAVFPDCRPFQLEVLPTAPAGLAALDINDRIPSLEAFRVILARWPGAPSQLSSSSVNSTMSTAELEALEKIMVEYYVQRFFEAAGRPPILPHVFPVA